MRFSFLHVLLAIGVLFFANSCKENKFEQKDYQIRDSLNSIDSINNIGKKPEDTVLTYINKKHHFSLNYPSAWIMKEINKKENKAETIVAFINPETMDNCSVLTYKMPPFFADFDNYMKEQEQYEKEEFKDYKIIHKESKMVNGNNAYITIKTLIPDAKSGVCEYYSYSFLVNDNVYSLMCFSSVKTFDDNKDDFELIMNSFHILEH